MRCPVPRVVVECVTSGCSSVNSSLRRAIGNAPMTPTEASIAVVVVQPEQQRADRVRPALVHPVAGDDAVGGPLVLDLEHHPLVGLVGAVERLGDDPVQPGALELARTSRGAIAGSRVAGVTWIGGRGLARAPDLERRPPRRRTARPVQVVVAERQQVESDERGRGLLGQQPHPAAAGWMRCCSASKSSPCLGSQRRSRRR